MSAHEEQTTTASESNEAEQNNETSTGFFPDLIEEKMKAKFEPLHVQISALTQMMEMLIQGNSAREFPKASTREHRFPSELSLTDGPGTPTIAPMTTSEYSPDNGNSKLIKYQRGHMFYLYAISIAIATTMLIFTQFGIFINKACISVVEF